MPQIYHPDKLPPLPEPDMAHEAARDDREIEVSYSPEALRAYAAAAVAAERERCAQIAERGDEGDWSRSTGDFDAHRGRDIAAAIRAGDTAA